MPTPELLEIINNNFTNEEEKLFVKNFVEFIDLDPKEFSIDIKKIWKHIGFASYKVCETLIIVLFKKDVDYIKSDNGNVMINVKCFKEFCLRYPNEKSREIYEFYLKLEDIGRQYNRHLN